MRIFILKTAPWGISSALVHTIIMDILAASTTFDQAHFYIVGDDFSASQTDDFAAMMRKDSSLSVELIRKQAAINLMPTITNAVIVHFGDTLKGSDRFAHYFIPLGHPGFTRLNWIQKWIEQRKFSQFIAKATSTFCLNEWVTASLSKSIKATLTPVHLPLATRPHFEWQDLAASKEAIAGGNPYFLSFSSVDEIVPVLKEFSIFKKWQQTSMSLVFIVKDEHAVSKATLELKGYKFKEDIYIYSLDSLTEQWLAASYAILLSNIDFEFSFMMQWAVQHKVPLLINQQLAVPDSWKPAGEIFDFQATYALSNHFKLYYKDELYRQSKANSGIAWLNQLTTDSSVKFQTKIPAAFKS